MKERMELTGVRPYPTLDRTRPFERVLFTMDQGHSENPQKQVDVRLRKTGAVLPRSENAATVSKQGKETKSTGEIPGMAYHGNSQAEREAARAIWEAVKETGQALTPDQLRTLRNLNHAPIIAGGDDSPENDAFDPGENDVSVEQGVGVFKINPESLIAGGSEREAGLHPALEKIVKAINERSELGFFSYQDLAKEAEKIINLKADGTDSIPNDQRQRLLRQLSQYARQVAVERADAPPDRFGFYLDERALRILDVDPMKWLDDQFNQIYELAKAGNELDSPILQRIQTLVGEASGYLQEQSAFFRREKVDSPEALQVAQDKRTTLEEFNTKFGVRLNLIFARSAVEMRSMEQIQGAVNRLKVDGMMGGLSYDSGRVGAMFGRMQGQLEYLRLAEGGAEHHLNPESLNKLQKITIDEQIQLAINGLGPFADLYKSLRNSPENRFDGAVDDALRTEVQRSVRTAYDILVISQRVALVSSRGEHHGNNRQYFSDSGAAFQVLNLEEFSINKWELFNQEEEHFFDFVKIDLAINKGGADPATMTREQLLDLGARLFKDLYAVPDFFSSSWRMTGIREQMIDTMRYKLQNDRMIEKLVEDEGFNPDDVSLQELQKGIKDEVSRGLNGWIKMNPEGQRIEGDYEIARRKIARDIFEKTLTKGQRDLALTSLNLHDIADVESTLLHKTGSKNGYDVGDIGLYLQLRQNLVNLDYKTKPDWVEMKSDKKDDIKTEHRKEVWRKIQKYKTEDIIRIVRGRAKGHLYHEDADNLREIDKLFGDLDPALKSFSSDQQEQRKFGGLEAFTTYDKFQEKYGAILYAVRQDAMKNSLNGPEQVDFTSLSTRHKHMIDRALGEGSADTVRDIFKAMNRFIDNKGFIDKFMNNAVYNADLYTRVISVDDINLEDLQNVPENSGLISLSGKWTAESGGDALKRNLTDIGNALNAGNAFIKFITVEGTDDRFKASKEMKGAVEAYNGRSGGVDVMRFTYGTELLYAMQDYWINVLRLGGLPFRKPTSQKQRDYGIGAHSLTRDQIREILDHHATEFVGRGPEAHKWMHQLEQITEVDAKGRLKFSTLTMMFYALLGLTVGLPLGAAYVSVNEATK